MLTKEASPKLAEATSEIIVNEMAEVLDRRVPDLAEPTAVVMILTLEGFGYYSICALKDRAAQMAASARAARARGMN